MKVSVGEFELNCEVEGKEGAPWVTFSHALGNNLTPVSYTHLTLPTNREV